MNKKQNHDCFLPKQNNEEPIVCWNVETLDVCAKAFQKIFLYEIVMMVSILTAGIPKVGIFIGVLALIMFIMQYYPLYLLRALTNNPEWQGSIKSAQRMICFVVLTITGLILCERVYKNTNELSYYFGIQVWLILKIAGFIFAVALAYYTWLYRMNIVKVIGVLGVYFKADEMCIKAEAGKTSLRYLAKLYWIIILIVLIALIFGSLLGLKIGLVILIFAFFVNLYFAIIFITFTIQYFGLLRSASEKCRLRDKKNQPGQ